MLLTVKGIVKEIAQDVGLIFSETKVSCIIKRFCIISSLTVDELASQCNICKHTVALPLRSLLTCSAGQSRHELAAISRCLCLQAYSGLAVELRHFWQMFGLFRLNRYVQVSDLPSQTKSCCCKKGTLAFKLSYEKG